MPEEKHPPCNLVTEHHGRIDRAEQALSELPHIRTSLGGIRDDVRQLRDAVLKSLDTNTSQEREIGRLREKVASIATTSGKKAGRSIATKVSVVTSLILALAYLLTSGISALSGKPLPDKPPKITSGIN